jgi:hypothetical protein
MATHVRPCTPYMMNALPESLNRSDLSPSSARFADALGDASATARAFFISAAPGRDGSGGAGRSRRDAASMSAAATAPTVARRNRGASAEISKRHQRSREYSTCLKEKKPSQTLDISTRAIAAIHRGVNRSWVSDAFRWKCRRQAERPAGSLAIASSSSAFREREDDPSSEAGPART